MRCLSMTQMKVTDGEVQALVKELDKEESGQINYIDFMKYSFLAQMFL